MNAVLNRPATTSRPRAQDAVIAATGLTKRYRSGVLAVDGVDLEVHRGEVYGFLGSNGAGKTTTMRMLLGLIRPTAGTVSVLGEPPGAPGGLCRLGALVESPGFYPYLSGRDNLRALARRAGVGRSGVEAALDAVGLTGRAGDRFATYSLGMKQRLGVASALLGDPELLVLDEPTNGLDPAGMADMRSLVRRRGDEGRAVLLSSHLLGEVQQVCDRVGIISRGRLIAESTVAELRGKASLVVTAQPLDVAHRCTVSLLGADRVRLADGVLRLDVEPADAARVNRELVAAGVDVSQLRHDERSLEDVFLELTTSEEGTDVR